jgi:hypothetical protein
MHPVNAVLVHGEHHLGVRSLLGAAWKLRVS